MDKDVLIHVRGMQIIDAEAGTEPIEIIVPGQYFFRNGNHYLRYEEQFEEFGEPTINYIKMTPHSLEVQKHGPVNMSMIFEEGRRDMSIYSTPFGTFQMGIVATSLDMNADDTGIHIQVEYSLEINDEHMSDCSVTIEALPKAAKID